MLTHIWTITALVEQKKMEKYKTLTDLQRFLFENFEKVLFF